MPLLDPQQKTNIDPPLPPGATLDPPLPAGATLDVAPSTGYAAGPTVGDVNSNNGPSAGQKLFGNSPVSDTISNVGTHLKNLVTGPYHAFTDTPQNATEQRIKSLPGNSGLLGQLDLGATRMFAEPTAKAVQQVGRQAKAGNYGLGLKDTTYDDQGNYHPTALSSAMDAVPIAGPWARSVETEAHQKGWQKGNQGE